MNTQFFVYVVKTFKILLVFTIAVLFFRAFIIEPGRVNGRSMEDTFIDEDIFFVNKFVLLFRAPRRGDIIQFIEPDTHKLIIKRIIGLPGEQVVVKHNQVFIVDANHQETLLPEPYLAPDVITSTPTGLPLYSAVIPEHEYFVLGDNRPYSTDSRVYGPIHRSYIQGALIH